MQQQGPKRRTTQIGMGQSGTLPRADEEVPGAPHSERGSAPDAAGVLCPPPSRPPNRTRSAEHATVEFSDEAMSTLRESVRERAASAPDAVEQRAREELRLRDSVRERIAARRSSEERILAMREVASRAETLPAQARAEVPAAREPSLEAREREAREARDRLTRAAREEREAHEREVKAARERDLRQREAAARERRDVPASPPRSERDTNDAPPVSQRSRAALRVDEVGAAAVRLAVRAPRDATPKVLLPRRALASAPIDHREAFLVSLIDGVMTAAALVDVSGMPETEVMAALQRLARLGIVSL